MATGIRATVEFDAPGTCPMADLSRAAETTIGAATSSVGSTDGVGCATDVTSAAGLGDDHDLTALFSGGGPHWYRLEREPGVGCPCELLGGLGIPVARYRARDGTLTLAFHAVDFEQLKAVVADLRERYPDVDIKRFVRSPGGDRPGERVSVDRGRLTDRQLEVLETALDMGYFERPRRANATDVAAALDVNPSTFSEHLAAAQRKLFEEVLERGR